MIKTNNLDKVICPVCNGAGETNTQWCCSSCDGTGQIVDSCTKVGRIDKEKMIKIFEDMFNEFYNATLKFNKFNSSHEGYAVLLEEVDELWEEVKKKSSLRDIDHMREEANQIGAMAMRFIYDLCEKE